MPSPAFVSMGTGASLGSTPGNVPYPAGIQAGDLLFLLATSTKDNDTITTPAGWTAYTPAVNTFLGKSFLFSKVAAGTESGNLSLTWGAGGRLVAAIFRFTTPLASAQFTTPASHVDEQLTADDQPVTSDAPNSLALNFVAIPRSVQTLGSFTGETGGNWTTAAAFSAGSAADSGSIALQTAVLATSGLTVTGGTVLTDPGYEQGYAVFGLALRGTASASPATSTPWVPIWPNIAQGALVLGLPYEARDGQEVTLADSLTAPTYLWRMRYHAATTRWWCVGGAPATAIVATAEATSGIPYTDLATPGPDIVVPMAGDYVISCGAQFRLATASKRGGMSYALGATAASDVWGMQESGHASTDIGNGAYIERTYKHLAVTAGALIRAKYRGGDAGEVATFQSRYLSVLPVRIG